ncbi:MAG: hypothetical protein AB7I32_16590, partial [Gammaproteobacteria bacterium]
MDARLRGHDEEEILYADMHHRTVDARPSTRFRSTLKALVDPYIEDERCSAAGQLSGECPDPGQRAARGFRLSDAARRSRASVQRAARDAELARD